MTFHGVYDGWMAPFREKFRTQLDEFMCTPLSWMGLRMLDTSQLIFIWSIIHQTSTKTETTTGWGTGLDYCTANRLAGAYTQQCETQEGYHERNYGNYCYMAAPAKPITKTHAKKEEKQYHHGLYIWSNPAGDRSNFSQQVNRGTTRDMTTHRDNYNKRRTPWLKGLYIYYIFISFGSGPKKSLNSTGRIMDMGWCTSFINGYQ